MVINAVCCSRSSINVVCQWSKLSFPQSPLQFYSSTSQSCQPLVFRNYATKTKPSSPRARRLPTARINPHKQMKHPSGTSETVFPLQPTFKRTYNFPSTNTYARLLSEKATPTLLYVCNKGEAGAFAKAAFAGLIGGIALVNVNAAFTTPGLWWIIPWLTLAYNSVLMGAATLLFIRTTRPVSSISAVPVKEGLKLVVQGSRGPRLPLTNFRLWSAATEECTVTELRTRNSAMQSHLPRTPEERKAILLKEDEEARRSRNESYFIFRILRIPYKWLRDVVENIIMEKRTVRLSITRSNDSDGTKVTEGPTWRMDLKSSWMLDEGRALNQLCREAPDWREKRLEDVRKWVKR